MHAQSTFAYSPMQHLIVWRTPEDATDKDLDKTAAMMPLDAIQDMVANPRPIDSPNGQRFDLCVGLSGGSLERQIYIQDLTEENIQRVFADWRDYLAGKKLFDVQPSSHREPEDAKKILLLDELPKTKQEEEAPTRNEEGHVFQYLPGEKKVLGVMS